MAIALKQIVLNDELLLSQMVSNESVIRLLIEKEIFTKEEFLEMVGVVDREMRIEGRYIVGEVHL